MIIFNINVRLNPNVYPAASNWDQGKFTFLLETYLDQTYSSNPIRSNDQDSIFWAIGSR